MTTTNIYDPSNLLRYATITTPTERLQPSEWANLMDSIKSLGKIFRFRVTRPDILNRPSYWVLYVAKDTQSQRLIGMANSLLEELSILGCEVVKVEPT